ncbi:hypothetical protein UPYG_G00255430 [Umbra pygmaea]|uniref:Immunoglobulin V-set domain-containing protein n=1 Tax=Umbra pygmaea TaxID=75934 RepID=A0ABD0W8Q9_UMBPY
MTMGVVFQSFVTHFMILLSLITVVSGNYKYFNVEDDVTLPCKNVLNPGNCTSTTWNYQRPGIQRIIEEVRLGIVKKEIKPNRADRLSVGSDCSLHVSDVRAEDVGTYLCRQYLTKDGPQQGMDETVYLSLLNISSSTPLTELKSDETVTLRCHIHTFDGKCNSHIISSVTLYLYETGADPQGDSRHKVTHHSRCDITVTLRKKENKQMWTCELTERGQVKTSINFPITGSPFQQQITVGVAVGVSMGVAMCVIATVIILHRRRTKNQMPADGRLVNNKDLGLTAVNHSTTPANEDKVHDGATEVNYASIMTSSDREPDNPPDLSSLYATVN